MQLLERQTSSGIVETLACDLVPLSGHQAHLRLCGARLRFALSGFACAAFIDEISHKFPGESAPVDRDALDGNLQVLSVYALPKASITAMYLVQVQLGG